MDIGSILSMIDKAILLYDGASDLFEKIKPSVDNITGDKSKTLEEANARLDAAATRARSAHDDLEAAISAKLAS